MIVTKIPLPRRQKFIKANRANSGPAGTLPGLSREQREALNDYVSGVKSLSQEINGLITELDSRNLSLDKLVGAANGDPNWVFDWVRGNTRLVAYPGLLRGSEGVLEDGDGNSADRSILLVELLSAMELPTRIARAELTGTQADLLYTHLADFHQALVAPDPKSMPLKESESEIDRVSRDVVPALVSDLLDAAEPHRIDRRQEAELERQAAVAALSDHWWVQVNMDGVWVDFDPTLAAPGQSWTQPTETFEPREIPEDLYHTVEIRLVLEKWTGDRLGRSVVLDFKEEARALAGDAIRLEHIPIGFVPTTDAPLPVMAPIEELSHLPAWLPILTVGDERFIGRLIQSDGQISAATQENIEAVLAEISPRSRAAGLQGLWVHSRNLATNRLHRQAELKTMPT